MKLFVCVDRIGSNSQLPLNNQDLASKNVSIQWRSIILSSTLFSSVDLFRHYLIAVAPQCLVSVLAVVPSKTYLMTEVCI
jgi:hypothetical protein